MELILKGINKSFEDNVIYKDFSIEFESSTINCILGKSGGGKSTLLNIIAGIENADSGSIKGASIDEISYIFQEDRLIPWLTIRQNIELFMYNYYNKEEAHRIMADYLKILEIEYTLDAFPFELSGGERQRVNILRALIKPSKVVLMDEPFKSLDYKVKYSIMSKVKEIFLNEERIVIFVTHDVDEAIYMSESIYILGGTPFEVKAHFKNDVKNLKNQIISLI